MTSIPLIQQFCQGWRLSQIKTFSVVWSAFLQCKSGILNEIAEEITKQTGIAITHTAKRIQRFLGNENIDQRTFYRNITRFVYRRIRHWETIPIAIDWTHCEKHEAWKTLAASIVVRGRGIPILIWPFRKDSLDGYLSRFSAPLGRNPGGFLVRFFPNICSRHTLLNAKV